jgi:3,4-dihydroxy 2-butanone 4-phosphate synthase/GTP cyclohydrolase II
VDAHQRFGVTTGISAQDRAKTIEVLVDPDTEPGDLRRPGHIFPLKARPGGVLRRVGQTEAAVDLANMAGLPPVGVICEILNSDGTMARRPQLEVFAKEHDLRFITVADLVSYRLTKERLVTRVAEANLPTEFGPFRIIAYQSPIDDREHVALVKGDVEGGGGGEGEGDAEDDEEVLVRMHSECLTGDVFGSERCECGPQMHAALDRIQDDDQGGLVIYMSGHEGRGIGLWAKAATYLLQDAGEDTYQANRTLGLPDDSRDFSDAASLLKHFVGNKPFRLLTNNPKKVNDLADLGLEGITRVKHVTGVTDSNRNYLTAKQTWGHKLDPEDL